ncbi:hypothetical protein XbrCFBP1976_02445 [Xanthomonas bromi]|uniref:Uncharacterized protein n=1 Tax=Xanthomonas bromi TaxID=56449 RepID=A0ABX5BTX5_9XANT|nr:hypothetical protein XbrCFBP1976_02445 [Xanthomonas bromi]
MRKGAGAQIRECSVEAALLAASVSLQGALGSLPCVGIGQGAGDSGRGKMSRPPAATRMERRLIMGE